VNDAPTISDIADITINEDSNTGALTFTAGDVETPAADLSVAASSSNLTLVPQSGIALGGTGANRTITATPVANGFGSATITFTVRDADSATATNSFVVTVVPINDAPTISHIADQTIFEDTVLGPISFAVGDVETLPGNL